MSRYRAPRLGLWYPTWVVLSPRSPDCHNIPLCEMKEESEPKQVDLTDLMEVICGYRRERFSFERLVAAMTFSAWLHFPLDPDMVEFGRLMAAANVIRALKNGFLKLSPVTSRKKIDSIFRSVITADVVCRLLLKGPAGGFEDWPAYNSKDICSASGISNFLVQCPPDLKPSLNKAFFFIDERGYPGPASVSTTKKLWAEFAPVVPFASAAYFFELARLQQGIDMFPRISLFRLPPDGDKSVDDATTLMYRTDDLRDYFSVCRFIQEKMLAVIGSQAQSRVPFVIFPKAIKPKPVEIHPLKPDQIDIVKRYRAPKVI
jgi:hypothetical protein